jgi:putative ABC transport system permease protein
MLHHYLKSTLRHGQKSKLNFCFKLAGLVLALMSFLVIVLYVSYQLSFDRYHEDYKNVYRVNSRWRENGEMVSYAILPTGIGPMLKSEFPEVRAYARLGGASRYLIRYEDKSFQVDGIADADSSIFNVLSFKFLQGDHRALQSPNSIVLARSLATQIFGNDNPLDKTISFVDRSGISLQVTGVIEDMPKNSHLNIQALTSFSALTDSSDIGAGPWEIGIDGLTTMYLRLASDSDPNQFASKALPQIRKRLTANESGLDKEYGIWLQPLKDIYLDTPIYAEFCAKGNPVYVYVFSVLAFFLLAISSINYVNLSIADFHTRHREIGVRKVMGARKKQIAFQVILEAGVISFISLAISIGGLYLLFPQIRQMLDPNLRFVSLLDTKVMLIVGCIMGLLVLLSTAYPAYQLAVNNPIDDLKARSAAGKHLSLSKILLLSQITIAVICITATFVVSQQLQFIQSRNPGYDRHNLVVVALPDRYPAEKNPVMKNEFEKLAGVEAVSFSAFRIAGAGYYRDWYRVEVGNEMKRVMLNEVFFDHDFFRATGIPLVAGRSFDPAKATDSHEAFIVNETAVREFGWKDPIGKRISYGYDEPEGEKWDGTIVGVVKDFNVYSLHRKIEPLVMRLPWSDWPGNCLHVRINGPFDETLARIKKKYEEILPGFILTYSVIDELYDSQYRNERRAFASLQLSTWVIVLISSLGIFSLSVYISMTRMKEFAIRKVLGATGGQITLLHAGKFIKVALVANAIALPAAWTLSRLWLEEFAYKTEVNNVAFLLVAMLSMVLVLISVGYSAWRSGRSNPIEVIKSE